MIATINMHTYSSQFINVKSVCRPPGEDAPVSGVEVHLNHRRLVPHQPVHHSQRPAGGAAGTGTGPVMARSKTVRREGAHLY